MRKITDKQFYFFSLLYVAFVFQFVVFLCLYDLLGANMNFFFCLWRRMRISALNSLVKRFHFMIKSRLQFARIPKQIIANRNRGNNNNIERKQILCARPIDWRPDYNCVHNHFGCYIEFCFVLIFFSFAFIVHTFWPQLNMVFRNAKCEIKQHIYIQWCKFTLTHRSSKNHNIVYQMHRIQATDSDLNFGPMVDHIHKLRVVLLYQN